MFIEIACADADGLETIQKGGAIPAICVPVYSLVDNRFGWVVDLECLLASVRNGASRIVVAPGLTTRFPNSRGR